jgi:hypothetical protein
MEHKSDQVQPIPNRGGPLGDIAAVAAATSGSRAVNHLEAFDAYLDEEPYEAYPPALDKRDHSQVYAKHERKGITKPFDFSPLKL